MQKLVLVAIGANLFSSTGCPAETLRNALRAMPAEGLAVRRLSRFWRTPAHPPGSGPNYINGAATLASDHDAAGTLEALHRIEARFGRLRDGGRWQSRTIDLDLLAVGDTVLPDAATQDGWRNLAPEAQARLSPRTLILPHPRLQDRGFVLAPLAEIAPAWRHPRTGLTVARMLADLPSLALAGMAPMTGSP
ncbi:MULTISPECIES: 2-amino-4-hydroxy-6-hydroxymethyldihydropteridine diphosphokinase [unclassified Paracoccus (in: a-proteobacteria)]|uniref:2-amino-4-hydroxy-6- hydroxymethyldihydropteridine diphosphokinase n=1 Tax=unclassified Paracoccus (in: a-proteobacteria) TaxID=2688777 RepID=UPI00160227B3|nr:MULTISPECIES: 2-amino-4-hydroxy-6-hydroxymethyldihydropteridine diphosphokinase [unclassified Paracoccus (in: a-proteobacteria)]MBB1491993.1 2-amino-4-hydroxy-6-hydroxymethyldihydropteridine diphosphokinase [Paracoccus sp. MC1854]MBB1498144.1 2-amino-4-hydroxy-6-hydroxymethyldihydropteridine diphosphokinase [Paracoccus sp. MC1862]QQO45644.1 2-amino-4-hydroxy-6-hydroxymethyldihydropteridine diphosphokinase [Paracoccus sp. MC1862]